MYRKSKIGSSYLQQTQKENALLIQCLPFNVLIRLGSTLATLRRFLILKIHINNFTSHLHKEKAKLGHSEPSIPRIAAGVHILGGFTAVLDFAEEGTRL